MRTLGRKLLATTLLLGTIANTVNITLVVNANTGETTQEQTAICISGETKYLSGTITEETIKEKLPSLEFTMGECGEENEDEIEKTKEEETSTGTIQEENSKKQKICKVQPNGKSHTVEVSIKVVDSILKDGLSYLGECSKTQENKIKNVSNSNENCKIYDSNGNQRTIWNKTMLSNNPQDKQSVETLYKICDSDLKTINPSNPHSGCLSVLAKIKAKHDLKGVQSPGLTRKFKLCQTTGYPMHIKSQEEQDSSILLNSGDDTVESLSINIELNPTGTPDYMRFSEDSTTWSDWEPFSYNTQFLISSLSGNKEKGLKTIYVQYIENGELSKVEYDQITLVNKYDYQLTLTNNGLEKNQQYQAGKIYKFEFSAKNLGSQKWTSNTMLSYKILDPNNQVINTATNFGLLENNTEVNYNETTTIKIPVRLENNISGDITIVFDMLENGVGNFSDFGAKPLLKTIQVTNPQQEERKSLYNTESLSFGVGDYTAIKDEPTPEIITVCNELGTNVYSINEDMSVFQTKYQAGFGRSIHAPNIYYNYVNTSDNTVFHSLKYSEYIQDNETLYIYRDASQINSEYCDSEMAEYSNLRECEQHYDDVSSLSDNECLDITKATSLRLVEGNKGSFLPNDDISKAEAVKLLLGASNTAVMPYEVGSINDLTGEEWYADHIYSAYKLGIINLDNNNNSNALEPLTYSESIQAILEIFNFNPNSCDYSVIRQGNQYISAGLYFGIIKESNIPSSPDTENVTRMSMVSSMLNAYYQQNSIDNSGNSCPNSIDDRLTRNIQEICSTEKQAILSSSNTLNEDGISLDNNTKVEVLETTSNIAKIHVEGLAVAEGTGYLPTTQLAENCNLPTPTDELKEPKNNEVVVASLVGIYAHTQPSATSGYFDYNKDGQANNQDIIPYNTVLTVLETKGNWFKVEFQDQRTAWIFNGFVAIGPDVEIFTPETKVTGTISWDYGVTVDLRANTNTDTKENIIWETYENTKVQVLGKDETNNLYYVKIESTEKNLTQEIFDTHYARLYPNFTLEEVQSMENGIAGWVHEDLVKLDGVDYSQNQTLNYPFDYESLSNSGMTVDRLVTQIFFEEFNGDIHDAMDFNLEAGEKVKAVANGTIQSAGTGTVTVLHEDGKKSTYHHIVTSENILNGTVKTVTPETVLGVVAPDTTEFKAHLHFELKGENGESLNPAKYFKTYNSQDSHKCMRELVIGEGIYDGEEVKEKCDVGIGNGDERCTIDYCRTSPNRCVGDFGVVDSYGDATYYDLAKQEIEFDNIDNKFRITEVNNTGKTKIDFKFVGKYKYGYLEKSNINEDINFVPFTDVNQSNYCTNVKFAKKQNWINGGKSCAGGEKTCSEENKEFNGMFYPTSDITREAALKIILRAAAQGNPKRVVLSEIEKYEGKTCGFDDLYITEKDKEGNIKKDINGNPIYLLDGNKNRIVSSLSKYVCYAKEMGRIKGYSDTKFGPEDPMNYSQAQRVISNVFDIYTGIDNMTGNFTEEVMKRDMFTYFLYNAFNYDEMDMEKIGECVLHSKEKDIFAVRDNNGNLLRVKFVGDDWKESEGDKFTVWQGVFRSSFLDVAKNTGDCDLIYSKGLLSNYAIDFGKKNLLDKLDEANIFFTSLLLLEGSFILASSETEYNKIYSDATVPWYSYSPDSGIKIIEIKLGDIEIGPMKVTLKNGYEVNIPEGTKLSEIRLDVSSYMLYKFLHGSGEDDIGDKKYTNFHSIGKKFMETDFFQDNKNSIISKILEGDNYNKLLRGETIYSPKGNGSVIDSNSITTMDFGLSFGTISWQTSAIYDIGRDKITMKLHILDNYVFNDYNTNGELINGLFNNFAKYLQDNGLGMPFTWELEVTDVITKEELGL